MSTCPCGIARETCDYHKPAEQAAARPARVGTRLKCRLVAHGFTFPVVEAAFGPDGRNVETIFFGPAGKACRVVGWEATAPGFKEAGFFDVIYEIAAGDLTCFQAGAACIPDIAFDAKPDDQLADWDRRFSDAKDYA